MSKIVTEFHRDLKKNVENSIHKSIGIPLEAFVSRDRGQEWSRARFLAFYILHEYFRISYTIIGMLYQKDHTTIMNGVQMISKLKLKNQAHKLFLSTYTQG